MSLVPATSEMRLNSSLKVGAALSMTYVTGQPIIFVGCGQVRSLSICIHWLAC